MKRTLSLKRETLAALTSDDLAAIAGAAPSVPGCFEPASLDPVTGCIATVRESVLVCSGRACNTWDSDCSCRV